jgi:hypothetical protein
LLGGVELWMFCQLELRHDSLGDLAGFEQFACVWKYSR